MRSRRVHRLEGEYWSCEHPSVHLQQGGTTVAPHSLQICFSAAGRGAVAERRCSQASCVRPLWSGPFWLAFWWLAF